MANILNTGKAMYAWDGNNWIPINAQNNIVNSTRWQKIATGGETTLSELDDNDNLLRYSPGFEQVFLNGILLVRNSDYTASNGTSITGLEPISAGANIEIIALKQISLANVYNKSEIDSIVGNIDLSSASAAAVAYLTNGAPEALDTLLELSAALNDDPNFYNTIANVYLSQSSASSTYLSQFSASSTYISQLDVDSTFAKLYFLPVSVSANYQLQLSDIAKVIEVDSSSTVTVTVPTNADVAFPIGTVINVYRQGTGAVIIEGSEVTIRNVGSITDQYAEVSLRKRATDEWVLVGNVS